MERSMKIVDKQQVLSELGISERTLEGWVKAQRFPAPVQLGRRVCWTREALEHWKTLTFAYQLEFQPRRAGGGRAAEAGRASSRRT